MENEKKRKGEETLCELDSAVTKVPRNAEATNNEPVHDVEIDHWSDPRINEMMHDIFRIHTDRKTEKLHIRLCISTISREWETVLGPIMKEFLRLATLEYRFHKFSQSWLSVGKSRWILLGDLLGLLTDRTRRLSVKGSDRVKVVAELNKLLSAATCWNILKRNKYIDWMLGSLVERLFPRAPYVRNEIIISDEALLKILLEDFVETGGVECPPNPTCLYLHIEAVPMWRILLPRGKHQWDIADTIRSRVWALWGDELKYYHMNKISAQPRILDSIIKEYVDCHKKLLVSEFVNERTARDIVQEIKHDATTLELQEIANLFQQVSEFPQALRAAQLTTICVEVLNIGRTTEQYNSAGKKGYIYPKMQAIIRSIENKALNEILQELRQRVGENEDPSENVTLLKTWHKKTSKVWDKEKGFEKRLYTSEEQKLLLAIAEEYFEIQQAC